ncbi:hypothetical protein ACVR0S_03510 [Streptococcus dentapri]|uniref:Phage protein n=1 Tax=Streptococcus dentapri TaxID=573564 RepID=A0ABV8D2J3_9STRE
MACEIKLRFVDGEVIKFGASYDKNYHKISQGGIVRKLTNNKQQYLKQHKGTTTNKVQVIYSNNEKEER